MTCEASQNKRLAQRVYATGRDRSRVNPTIMAHQFDTSVVVAFQYITLAFEYRYHSALSPVIWHRVCPEDVIKCFHYAFLFVIQYDIWTASMGSSSGPQAFPFPIFAICFFTSSNEKHSTL